MVIDIDIICMGDNIYAAKFKHEKFGLFKSIVEANSLKDAKSKININLKQSIWKKGISSKGTPISFYFHAKDIFRNQISFDKTPNELKKYHPDYIKEQQDQEDPRIWSLEEVTDNAGKVSYRTIKHDSPLMNKTEIQQALLAKMFK